MVQKNITRILSRVILIFFGGFILVAYQNCSPIGKVGGFDPNSSNNGTFFTDIDGDGIPDPPEENPEDPPIIVAPDPIDVPGTRQYCDDKAISRPKLTKLIIDGQNIPLDSTPLLPQLTHYIGLDESNAGGSSQRKSVSVYYEYDKSVYRAGYESDGNTTAVTVDSNRGIIDVDENSGNIRLDINIGNNANNECAGEDPGGNQVKEATISFEIADAICYDNENNQNSISFKLNYVNNCANTKKNWAPTPGFDDQYGLDLDIDGNQMIVANYKLDGTKANQGGAHVYTYNSGTKSWDLETTLILGAGDDPVQDQTVTSVAIDGDYAILGSSYAAKPMAADKKHGEVLLFKRVSAGNWNLLTKIQAPTQNNSMLNAHAKFGHAVDLDNKTIVASAIGEDDPMNAVNFRSGAVFVFKINGDDTVAAGTDPVLWGTKGEDLEFGRSLSLNGGTLVVGEPVALAYAQNTAGTQAGKVYIFAHTGQGVIAQSSRILVEPGSKQDGMRFGFSVDTNGSTIVIGADRFTNGGSNRGKAYVCNNSGSCSGLPNFGNGQNNNYFGRGVAISPNGQNIFVGAPGAGGEVSENYGQISHFTGSGTSFSSYRFYRPKSNKGHQSENGLGKALSASNSLVIGNARGHVITNDRNGAVFTFSHQEDNKP